MSPVNKYSVTLDIALYYHSGAYMVDGANDGAVERELIFRLIEALNTVQPGGAAYGFQVHDLAVRSVIDA